jgi:hypothetical protein
MHRDEVLYFALAYGLSWGVYVPLALATQGWIAPLPSWLHLVGAYGPLLSALIVTSATGGVTGLRELVGRMTRWRIGWFWWGIALWSPIAMFLVAVAIASLVSGDLSALGQFGAVAELPGVRGFLG